MSKKASGFLGSTLFPSFEPLDSESAEKDAIEEQRLETPKAQFPSFSSFSFAVPAPETAANPPAETPNNRDSDSDNSAANQNGRKRKRKERKPKSKKPRKSKHDSDSETDARRIKGGGKKSLGKQKAARNETNDFAAQNRLYQLDPNASSNELAMPSFKKAAASGLDPFVFDRKGSSDNRSLGPGKQVPRYTAFGNRILGISDSAWRISRQSNRSTLNNIIVYKINTPKPRLTSRDFRRALRGNPIPIHRIMKSVKNSTQNEVAATEQLDYIPFPKLNKSILLQPTIDTSYETTETKSESNESFILSNNGSNIQESPEFIQQTKHLNLRLENNPKNLDTWIQLLQLQDSLLSASTASKASASYKSLCRIVQEKKQSIYEKALKHFTNPIETPNVVHRLVVPYLDVCENLWGDLEPAKLLTLWDRILKIYAKIPISGDVGACDAFELWDRYLIYRQTSSLSFEVWNCVDVFEECFKMFRVDSETSIQVQSFLLHIHLRLTYLLYGAGYTERAIALHQSLIEFNLFAPPAFEKMDLISRVDLFEEFWESECPRFGEDGAKGWKNNIIGGAIGKARYSNQMQQIQRNDDLDTKDEYQLWYTCESESCFNNWLPKNQNSALSEQEEGQYEQDEDPYSTVIFEDIRGFLFAVTAPNLKSRLVEHLLNILQCRFNNTVSTAINYWRVCSNAFIWTGGSECRLNNALVSGFFPKSKQAGIDTDVDAHKSIFPFKNFPASLLNLYASTDDQSQVMFDKAIISNIQESGHQKLDFIKHALIQSREVLEEMDDVLIPVVLSIDACGEGGDKSALKSGKTVLKAERMNLSLWTFYALLLRSKADEARKIFITTILSYKSFPTNKQQDAILVYLAFAQVELMEHNQLNRALNILVAFADPSFNMAEILGSVGEERPSSTRVLKAKKLYSELTVSAINKCIAQQNTRLESSYVIRISAGLVGASILLEYLVATDGMQEALKFTSNLVETYPNMPPALLELVIDMKLQLLLFHSKRDAVFVRPGDVRKELEAAVERFPCNTRFLTWFVAGEVKYKIENRVRRFIEDKLKVNPSLTLWLYSIWSELNHHATPGGQQYNESAVRALFTRATECNSSRNAPIIWHLFIIFELLCKKQERAKQLLFRAIRECPWSKGLYMMVASPELEIAVDGDEEKAEILAVMEEKEVRVRVPLLPH